MIMTDGLSPAPHRTPQMVLSLEMMGRKQSMKRRMKVEVATPPMDGVCFW